MGFYGNISNVNRTQFTFDRIYPSRKAMESVQTVDGVYIGRYILIEYDTDVHTDYYRRVYLINEKLYYVINEDIKELLTVENTVPGQIVRLEPDDYPENKIEATKFYSIKHNGNEISFELITGNDSNYSSNYNIDLKEFYPNGGGRGFDSTVWQKVYTEGIEKYVMVAELNTVVPTFDIVADAPTMSPRVPHFDADSTNVYYKLHSQPQWGVRLKSASYLETPKLKDDGTSIDAVYVSASEDRTNYPTDYNTQWTRHEYNRVTGESLEYYAKVENDKLVWTTESESEVPAAVYFNKAGFDPNEIAYSENVENNIFIEPTGQSGHTYSVHQAGMEKECDIDIQEMVVMLPGIGDSIAKMWDIVYGDSNLNKGTTRNTDINWNSLNGHRLVREENGFSTFNTDAVNTLAGCINSVHDLMGMIIVDNESDLSENNICYLDGKYYRQIKQYPYTLLDEENYDFNSVEINEASYKKGLYYIKEDDKFIKDEANVYNENAEYFVRVLTEDSEPYYVLEDSSGDFAKGALWNNSISIIPNTIELSTRGEVEYKKDELVGFSSSLNTIHGLILKINEILSYNNFDTRDLDTVQGCINNLKDIIAKFEILKPQEFVIIDNYGRIHSADFNTLQSDSCEKVKEFSDETTLLKGVGEDCFKNVNTPEDMRKQWITVNIDGDIENPKVSVHHNFQKVADTTSTLDNNSEENDAPDSIDLYTPIVDAMGHVVGKNIETVTLPYGFKTISTNGVGDSLSVNEGTELAGCELVADNTQDALALNSGNKWIRISSEEDDKLTFSHNIHDITSDESELSLSSEDSQEVSFDVPIPGFDEAGHFTSCDIQTYKMPFGYGNIKDDNNAITSATATFDTLQIASGDEWLETVASTDILTINHTGPIAKEVITKDNVSPKFGDSFTLEDWQFDEKGHKFDLATHTVTIPTLAVEDAASGNVLVDIEMTDDGQKVKEIKSNIGDLKLVSYVIGENSNVVTAEDTIGQAFGKLQVQINSEAANRQQAISQESANRSEAIASEVESRNTAISNAINIETINRNVAIENAFANKTFDYGDIDLNPLVQKQTIEWLFKKVAELEAQVLALSNPTV